MGCNVSQLTKFFVELHKEQEEDVKINLKLIIGSDQIEEVPF